jgi:hypothetical protein
VSKMLVSIDETTMCNIAEDSHLHTRCCENLTSSLLLKQKIGTTCEQSLEIMEDIINMDILQKNLKTTFLHIKTEIHIIIYVL